jgi:hypothetical protein
MPTAAVSVRGSGFRGGIMADMAMRVGGGINLPLLSTGVSQSVDILIPAGGLNWGQEIHVDLNNGGEWRWTATPNDNRPFRTMGTGALTDTNFGFSHGNENTMVPWGWFHTVEEVETSAPTPISVAVLTDTGLFPGPTASPAVGTGVPITPDLAVAAVATWLNANVPTTTTITEARARELLLGAPNELYGLIPNYTVEATATIGIAPFSGGFDFGDAFPSVEVLLRWLTAPSVLIAIMEAGGVITYDLLVDIAEEPATAPTRTGPPQQDLDNVATPSDLGFAPAIGVSPFARLEPGLSPTPTPPLDRFLGWLRNELVNTWMVIGPAATNVQLLIALGDMQTSAPIAFASIIAEAEELAQRSEPEIAHGLAIHLVDRTSVTGIGLNTANSFMQWFNNNRNLLNNIITGFTASGDITAILPTVAAPNGRNAAGTAGLRNRIIYSGLIAADNSTWSEVPYAITWVPGVTNRITIQLPTLAELGGAAVINPNTYLRLPVVAEFPDSAPALSLVGLSGFGILSTFIPGGGSGINIPLGAPTAAGGAFRVEFEHTNMANLRERYTFRQGRISIFEQGGSNFFAVQPNDPLRGFYFDLPGEYVWQNATSRGTAAGATADAGNAFGSPQNPLNNQMNGVGVELVNFGGNAWASGLAVSGANAPAGHVDSAGTSFQAWRWERAGIGAGVNARLSGTADAFGGVWASHREVLQAITNVYHGENNLVTTEWMWLQNNAVEHNGIITNLHELPVTSVLRNTNYAFVSHNGSRINVVLGNTNSTGAGTRQVRLTNLAVGHANTNNPVSGYVDVTIGNNIVGTNSIGNLGTQQTALVQSPNPANPLVMRTGEFVSYGFAFERATGAIGEIVNITSGRTYTEGAWRRQPHAQSNTVAMTRNDFAGRTAQVNLTEIAAASGFNPREFTFAATDADGYVLPDVKIAAVHFHTTGTGGNGRGITNTTFYNIQGSQGLAGIPNRNWAVLGGALGANAAWSGQAVSGTTPDPIIEFSPDGHHVAVMGLRTEVLGLGDAGRPQQNQRLQIQARFYLSVNPNFEGPIYISVDDNRNFDMQFRTDFITTDGIVHIANARKPVTVESTPTTANIGFATVAVNNIVISEDRPGDLRQGGTIEIGLGEHDHSVRPWSGLGFNAVSATNVAVTNANPNPSLAAAVNVATQPGGIVTLQVTRPTTASTPSVITLSNLSVQAHQSVPVGHYNLYVRGSAIMDNDYWLVNNRVNPGQFAQPLLQFNETGHRRYAFTHGLMIQDNPIFVSVVHPTPGGVFTSVLRATVGSNIVSVDNVTRQMTNVDGVATPVLNIQDRTFIPLRGLMDVLEGSVSWGFTNGPGTPVFVEIAIADRVVLFTVGSTTAIVNGQQLQMDVAPVNLDGSVYIPLGFIGQALNVPVNWVQETQTVWFNNTNEGVPMTVVAPLADVTPAADNGYDNGNDE